MAAEWDETCVDMSISDYGADTVIRLQAICRGWLVRKKLKDTQTEFQEIVHELEGPSMKVEWTQSALPHPVVCKASKKTRAWKPQQGQKHTCGQSDERKPSSSKPAECLKCADKMLTHTKTETVAKPDSVQATQSDQQVQTKFSQTDQLLLTSKEMHAEEDKKHESTATDSMLPVKESVCQTDRNLQSDVSQNQVCSEKDSLNTQTDPKVAVENTNSRGEHQAGADSDSDSDGRHMNIHVSTSSGMAVSHVSMLPSPIVASSEAVTHPVPESSGMRRVDSFHGDQTSVWDSSSSVLQDHEIASKRSRGGQPNSHGSGSATKAASPETGADMTEVTLRSLSTEELLKQRQNMAMELLWVQQAIISRKKYLKLKIQMDAAA